jgi:all-trans-8'-apo-beta-carotenal 15,15'-oxygenase
MEAAKPTELAPRDLATIGPTNLGVIRSMFSAHPHRVESRRTIYNFGLEYGRHNRIHLYALPDVGPARHLGAVDLSGPPMLHDFIATDNHLVFFVSPVRVDLPRMLTQIGTFEQLFRWQPRHGTEIVCVPIDRPSEVVRFTTEAFYQWHFANAFERDHELIVDYVRYPDFNSFGELGGIATGASSPEALTEGRYHRASIDLRKRALRSTQLADRPCEFPTLAPGMHAREHDLAYVVLDNFGAIGSIDARGTIVAHEVPEDERVTEPVYANGHLLALTHRRDRAFVAVYNAARIPDGPVAKIWLDHWVPITFHGVFAPDDSGHERVDDEAR